MNLVNAFILFFYMMFVMIFSWQSSNLPTNISSENTDMSNAFAQALREKVQMIDDLCFFLVFNT